MPPKLDTSTTFGTDLNCFSSTQSSSDFSSIRSYCGIGALQRVPVDLAHRATVRADLRLQVLRQVDLGKPLQHLLAIPIVFRFVVEDQHHAGKPEQRNRAQMFQVRKPVHHDFDGNRDLLLHFFGRPARPLRDDLDVVVGDVGVRFDGQVAERNDAPMKSRMPNAAMRSGLSRAKSTIRRIIGCYLKVTTLADSVWARATDDAHKAASQLQYSFRFAQLNGFLRK